MTMQVREVIPITPLNEEASLYEIRKKIYPRAVHGWFAGWRWAMVFLTQAVFYGTPWLRWNDRQAVLFDLGERKFYIFGLVFWPQDVIYLAILLILCALALFLFTAVAGRLWCGYACPQTVYTEIFLWIERKIEGDRLARIRLDAAPLSMQKVAIKGLKHAAWFAVALWTGYTFVGYFSPIQDLGIRAVTWQLGGWEAFWLLFYGFATWGNAGFMREQVCKYMCPYARFQGVMYDKDTLVITYDRERGEPRGSRRKGVDPREQGKGDCVDCHICVQVCPTGIDIRNGLQLECISCAACIDGCDQVMDKMGYPRGLIRHTTQNALAKHYDTRAIIAHVMRPRVLVYTAVIVAIAGATTTSLFLRNPLKVDVLRDRGALAREAAPGVIENVYRLQLMNTDEVARKFTIRATGVPGLTVEGVTQPVELGAAASRSVPIRLQAPYDDSAPAAQGDDGRRLQPIEIIVEAVDDPSVARHERSTFAYPR